MVSGDRDRTTFRFRAAFNMWYHKDVMRDVYILGVPAHPTGSSRSVDLNAVISANLTTNPPTSLLQPPHPSSATHHKTSSPRKTSHHHGSAPDPSSQPRFLVSALAGHPIRYSASATKSTSYKSNSRLRQPRRCQRRLCNRCTPTWTGITADRRRRQFGRRWTGRLR
jgi:hypothetical protein